MTALGILLLILGLVIGPPVLWVIGLVLIAVGLFCIPIRPGGRYWW